jgi:hypothetical protein
MIQILKQHHKISKVENQMVCLPRRHRAECAKFSAKIDELAVRAPAFLRMQWKGLTSKFGEYVISEFTKCVESAAVFRTFLTNVDKFSPPVLPGA